MRDQLSTEIVSTQRYSVYRKAVLGRRTTLARVTFDGVHGFLLRHSFQLGFRSRVRGVIPCYSPWERSRYLDFRGNSPRSWNEFLWSWNTAISRETHVSLESGSYFWYTRWLSKYEVASVWSFSDRRTLNLHLRIRYIAISDTLHVSGVCSVRTSWDSGTLNLNSSITLLFLVHLVCVGICEIQDPQFYSDLGIPN